VEAGVLSRNEAQEIRRHINPYTGRPFADEDAATPEGPHEIDQRVAWKRGPCRWVSWKTPNRGWFQCDLPEGHPGPHAYWRARPDLSNYSGAPTHQIETIPERGGVCTCVEGSDEWGKHRDPNCPVHGATDPRDCQPISDRLPVEVRFRA